jgi:hypothetical protein
MEKAGYTYLREHLELLVPPLGMDLCRGLERHDETIPYGQGKRKILAKTRVIGKTPCEHLETAIKYQGIRLSYLSPIFAKINKLELEHFILERPKSEIRRCIWYLYEWLMDERLNIPDSNANYIKLFDEKFYFTLREGVRDQRTRVINNGLGNKQFCPMIRKTAEVLEWSDKDMMQLALHKLEKLKIWVDTDVLGRSVSYLYTKETKSSTELEKEDSREEKTKKFFRVLKSSGTIPLSKERLLFVQNQIVQGDKKDTDYRNSEIYVGTTRITPGGVDEDIDYIGPKFEHVPSMMDGLLKMHEALMMDNSLPAMMHAAIVSFGLVYIHPFSDGNGRSHRYLIHDILKSRNLSGEDLIIPVSAAILQRQKDYDKVLETLSQPVMAMTDYDLIVEENNKLVINNDLDYLYRYPDLTDHVCFLYKMMDSAITEDLLKEITFIIKFDSIKNFLNRSYDIPNKQLDLLTNVLLHNSGKISNSKRGKFRDWLQEAEIAKIEVDISSLLDDMNKKFPII